MLNNNIYDENFLAKLDDLVLSQEEISSIYMYLSLFEDAMTDEEKALWSIILEKKDETYESTDEEIEDSDT